jgi:hypothetical protein
MVPKLSILMRWPPETLPGMTLGLAKVNVNVALKFLFLGIGIKITALKALPDL